MSLPQGTASTVGVLKIVDHFAFYHISLWNKRLQAYIKHRVHKVRVNEGHNTGMIFSVIYVVK